VIETHRYAEQYKIQRGNLFTFRSPVHSWVPVAENEIYVVMGLFLLMGIVLEQLILRDHEDLGNSLKSPNALSAAQRRGGGEPEQYAPGATRGCRENASLNTGANCEGYACTTLHNVM
jgi:hypothetical protein